MSNVTLVIETHVSTVTSFTTYCPVSTTLTYGNKTVVTSGAVTLTNGPYIVTLTETKTGAIESSSATPVVPVLASSAAASNATAPANITANATYASGNAAASNGLTGASLAGLAAVAAFLL